SSDVQHNAHMYYVKLKNAQHRDEVLEKLRKRGVGAVFHYIPLHSSPAGCIYGRFSGEDVHTTTGSERLIRLPLWYNMNIDQRDHVLLSITSIFESLI